MSLISRNAEINDYEPINQLSYELYHIHHLNRKDIFLDTDLCFTQEEYMKILQDRFSKILLLQLDDEVIAYTYLKKVIQKKSLLCYERQIVSIFDFVVSKKYQKKGYGRLLHQRIIDWAKEMKCYIIELDVWYFNQDAIQFYQKIGYQDKNKKMELFL